MKHIKYFEDYDYHHEDEDEDYEEDVDYEEDEEIHIPEVSMNGVFYHGSVIQDCEFFSDLSTEYSDWEAVWFSDNESIARAFGDIARAFGDNNYSSNTGEYMIIMKANIKTDKIADLMDMDLVERLKEFYTIEDFREIIPILVEQGFDGWKTTGSIGSRVYTDYAIFDNSVFNIVEMKIKLDTWTDYMSLDDAEEFLNSVCEKED